MSENITDLKSILINQLLAETEKNEREALKAKLRELLKKKKDAEKVVFRYSN